MRKENCKLKEVGEIKEYAPCKRDSFLIKADEMSQTSKGHDFSEVARNNDETMLREMCDIRNYKLIHEKSLEALRDAVRVTRLHLFHEYSLKNIAFQRLPDLSALPCHELLVQGKLNRRKAQEIFGILLDYVKLPNLIGKSNQEAILASVTENLTNWPIGYPLFNNLPQLKMGNFPVWLRKMESRSPNVTHSQLRSCVRDWVALFWIKALLHLARKVFRLCGGNRADHYTLFLEKTYIVLLRKGFDDYKCLDGGVKRIEKSDAPSNEDECRKLVCVVEGRKTRVLSFLLSTSLKRFEKQLHAALRACLPRESSVYGMGLFPKLLADARNKLDGRRAFIFKTDISKCFDNFDLELLLRLVEEEIELGFERNQGSSLVVYESTNKRNVLMGAAFGRAQAFDVLFNKLFNKKEAPSTTEYIIFDKDAIIRGIKKMLVDIKLRFKGSFYSQRVGIPQGCCLSNTLCCIYLDYLLSQVFDRSPTSTVIKYVDDFILIDSNLANVKNAARQLLDGLFGVKAAEGKSRANFSISGYNVAKNTEFVWTKWKFNESLERLLTNFIPSMLFQPITHHQLTLARLRLLRKHHRSKNLRSLATVMERAGVRKFQKFSSSKYGSSLSVLRSPMSFDMYCELASGLLPQKLFSRFYSKTNAVGEDRLTTAMRNTKI